LNEGKEKGGAVLPEITGIERCVLEVEVESQARGYHHQAAADQKQAYGLLDRIAEQLKRADALIDSAPSEEDINPLCDIAAKLENALRAIKAALDRPLPPLPPSGAFWCFDMAELDETTRQLAADLLSWRVLAEEADGRLSVLFTSRYHKTMQVLGEIGP
jgi:hypothetical protein